jgi:hypothetical protein
MAHHSDFHPVKRPGALTAKAHAAGESVQEFAHHHDQGSSLTAEQSRFAEVARKWHHPHGHGNPLG